MTTVAHNIGEIWNAGDPVSYQRLNGILDSDSENLLRNADFRAARWVSSSDAEFAWWEEIGGGPAVPAGSERRAELQNGEGVRQVAWGALQGGWQGLEVTFGAVLAFTGSATVEIRLEPDAGGAVLSFQVSEADLPSGSTVALFSAPVALPSDADQLSYAIEVVSGSGTVTVLEALLVAGKRLSRRVSTRLEQGLLALGVADDTGSLSHTHRGGCRIVPVYDLDIVLSGGGTGGSANFDLSTLPGGIADAADKIVAFAKLTAEGSEGGKLAHLYTTVSGTTVTVNAQTGPGTTWTGSTITVAVLCLIFPGSSSSTAKQAYPYS